MLPYASIEVMTGVVWGALFTKILFRFINFICSSIKKMYIVHVYRNAKMWKKTNKSRSNLHQIKPEEKIYKMIFKTMAANRASVKYGICWLSSLKLSTSTYQARCQILLPILYHESSARTHTNKCMVDRSNSTQRQLDLYF